MYYVIIGLGPNDLEIPLMLFTDKGEAEKLLNDNFECGFGRLGDSDYWDTKDGQVFVENTGNGNEPTEIAHIFFKDGDYYGGCGDCYALVLKRVVLGKPIVGWDLD